MRPLVGIAMRLEDDRCGLSHAYARAVERAGGIPLLLPVQNVGVLLERIDALVLPGGGDFVPEKLYPGVRFDPIAPRQLAFDRTLLRGALARDLPLLGICYGMQLLALELGGALHHDIPSDLPDAAQHRLPGPADRHALEWTASSPLGRTLGAPGEVNSRHHQAVSDAGSLLRVAARASDGVIEAVEDPSRPFCAGVQWHPETLGDESSERLFRALCATASGSAGSR